MLEHGGSGETLPEEECMRRLTIGVLAAGCLTLLIGTIAVTLPTTGQAREPGYRPSFDDCLNGQLGLGLCPQAGGAKKRGGRPRKAPARD